MEGGNTVDGRGGKMLDGKGGERRLMEGGEDCLGFLTGTHLFYGGMIVYW